MFVLEQRDTLAPFATSKSEAAFVTAEENVRKDADLSTDILLENIPADPTFVRATLRPYQVEGVNWLVAQYNKGVGGIIGDGKFRHESSFPISFARYSRNTKGQSQATCCFDLSPSDLD